MDVFFNILLRKEYQPFPLPPFLAIHIGLDFFPAFGRIFLLIKYYHRVLLTDVDASIMAKSVLGQLGQTSPFPEQWWYSWIPFIQM